MNYQQFKLKLLNNEGDIDDKKLNLWHELFGELWDICDDILDDSCSPNDTLPPHENYLVDGELIRKLQNHINKIQEEGESIMQDNHGFVIQTDAGFVNNIDKTIAYTANLDSAYLFQTLTEACVFIQVRGLSFLNPKCYQILKNIEEEEGETI
ncbi:hypothetical protein Cl131_gp107 [Aphanizomenon phage vB_AphaS-CL131]|nr:hypothetical protein Cl131_gp107 [Aphanizomenon phage vB_AphaS-CL131]